jgi:hypothetical protein
MLPFSDGCKCAYCSAPVDPKEVRAAREILHNLTEEAFWEVMDAMGPPAIEHARMHDLGFVEYFACLECVMRAMFSLVIAPGGHCMLG